MNSRTWSQFLLSSLSLLLITAASRAEALASDEARREFFESKIRPQLAIHCQSCHGSQKQEGGLRVDWREGLLKGGESGSAIEPGRPEESLLLKVIEHTEAGLEMPKKARKLPKHISNDFRHWISDGAFDPRASLPTAEESASFEWEFKLKERKSWWSLQPIARLPHQQNKGPLSTTIDQMIKSTLSKKSLVQAPGATRTELARRVAFVLTGLPPTFEQIQKFVNDKSSDRLAYEAYVDRLLASPTFGEKWARHWMDVVRYSDTYGYEWDMPAKGAWRYRDYLIRAFNQDIRFDQLVREQIAGDLITNPRINRDENINESLIGPMFYQLGEKRHGDSAEFDGIHQEMLHNKIDALSKSFQGIAIGCARCHDHKLDPISQREYYALAGALISPRWVSRTIDLPERNAVALAQLRSLKKPIRAALGAVWLETATHWPATWLGANPNGLWQKAVTKAGITPAWEDPLKAWIDLHVVQAKGGDGSEAWYRLKRELNDEIAKRKESNRNQFQEVADFTKSIPTGWSVEGVGFRDGPGKSGDFAVALYGDSAVNSLLPAGLFTHALSPRLNGALRSPYWKTLPAPWLNIMSCGGDFAAELTVVDNAFLTERQKYLTNRDPAWSSYPPFPELAGRHVYRELATKSSNPNFPPRVGLGGACDDKQIADPKSWFGVTRAVVGKAAGTPQDELSHINSLFQGSAPANLRELASRYAEWLRAALRRWEIDQATDEDVRMINWLIDQKLIPNQANDPGWPRLRALIADYRLKEKQVVEPATVNGMADLEDGFDYPLNIRGEYDQLGPVVPRGYLSVLQQGKTSSQFQSKTSGRLELADRIAAASNPLTARVFVNRVWQWVFGTGLVSTPDDFGRLGSPPSHPELLDELAGSFIDSGWSIKKLLRDMLLTETFRQKSTVSTKGLELDPSNRLLHHYPLRRLEAEEVRDAILATSGQLDQSLYGLPIDPHRANEDPQKRLVSGPIDGQRRRSIYIKIAIMEPPKFLVTFNQPPPKIPSGRRDVTNTPTQSLALLNDPFVIQQAHAWARRVHASQGTLRIKLADMLTTAYSRSPSPAEIDKWESFYQSLLTSQQSTVDLRQREIQAWSDLAHTLLNTKEFLYYQ
jgi:hypothetical protein